MDENKIIENYKIIYKMCKQSKNNITLAKDIKGIVLEKKSLEKQIVKKTNIINKCIKDLETLQEDVVECEFVNYEERAFIKDLLLRLKSNKETLQLEGVL